MSRSDRLVNQGRDGTLCDDGEEHRWQPLSFRFETQLLDKDGRVQIRQPAIDDARVYVVCMTCHAYTYIVTEWAGFYLGDPPSLDTSFATKRNGGDDDGER